MAAAAGDLVAALVAGATTGDVSPQAGQQLVGQLQPLLFPNDAGAAGQTVQQFDRLAQTFDHEFANGQITGSATIASLTRSIQALASALGTTVPAPSTPAPSTPPAPGRSKGDHGKGNGNS